MKITIEFDSWEELRAWRDKNPAVDITPTAKLGLPPRDLACLLAENLCTVHSVRAQSRRNLHLVPNLGVSGVKRVFEAIKRYDLAV